MPSPSPLALVVGFVVVSVLTAGVYLVGHCQPEGARRVQLVKDSEQRA
jgi:hypothetical protein